jgi:GNAT superfamily N-acetyltransferase
MIELRPASENDIPGLLELLAMLFTLEQDFSPDADKQRRGLSMLMRSQQAQLVVAVSAEEVIGMASVQLVTSTAEGALAGWVEDVVVAPAWRRQGIAGRMLEFLATWAQQKGATRLQLLADRDNQPALDFYRQRSWSGTSLIAMRKRLQ